ncbi:hypothetical protein BKI52_12590 [marine bacterium AO1-C]|nr:hypothetical protein BKI52_12590 [marine bacterium AO1-C]
MGLAIFNDQIIMSEGEFQDIAIFPQINNAGGSLDKDWYVFFSYRHPRTNRMKRFRVTKGINQHKTKKARLNACKKIQQDYRRKLEDKWNPFTDGDRLYADNISYTQEPGKRYQSTSEKFEHTIEHYLSETLENHKVNVRPATFQAYQTHARKFIEWLEKNNLDQQRIGLLTTADAQKFLNEMRLPNGRMAHIKTRWAYRNNLKRLFNLLLKQSTVITENPFSNTELPPAETTQAKRAFRDYEIDKIKAYCEKNQEEEIWAVIQFIFYTFIRPGELRNLKVNDIDLERGVITVRADISKNKKKQDVTIPKAFMLFLTEYIKDKYPKHYVFGVNGKRRGEEFFRLRMKKILDELGFESDVSLYSWKHTGVIAFYNRTKNIKAVQQQLRHHSLDQVNAYLHSLGLNINEEARDNFPTL